MFGMVQIGILGLSRGLAKTSLFITIKQQTDRIIIVTEIKKPYYTSFCITMAKK